ncbi:flagellar biosynthetic protein FliR [Paracoccus bogoriensis]|uniref:flagellar biosynthetic protein FliR n=1 Tax=Paracoccus bogoriensis TaxID=242065 RepID=UPI001FE98F32|nr:flagellar biosynthetic protein FliR [Paracoccus bogoriensis]
MMQQILAIIPQIDWALVLVYARVQACILILPALGERMLPARLRVALALAITPLLSDLVAMRPMPEAPLSILTDISSQMAIGFMTGAFLRLLALALDVAATAIAATASLSQIMGIQNETSPHPVGNLIQLAALAVLMALGLPVMIVEMLADSLRIWPPGALPDAEYVLSNGARIVADSFWLAMMLAAPFTLGGFLFQALSGVINRVMPSLPVIFIGAPASILLALVALAILAPLLISLWADQVLGFMLPVTP